MRERERERVRERERREEDSLEEDRTGVCDVCLTLYLPLLFLMTYANKKRDPPTRRTTKKALAHHDPHLVPFYYQWES